MNKSDLTANMSCCKDAASWAKDVRANEDTAMFIYRRLKRVVADFHRCGFVHGDIKPENIFLSTAAIVSLLDLGLASRVGEPCFGGTVDYVPYKLLLSEKATVAPAQDW